MLFNNVSVQVHAAEHIKKKTAQQLTEQTYVFVEKPSSGSSLFRKGIKRRNERKLLEHQRMQLVTCCPLWTFRLLYIAYGFLSSV